MNQEKDIVVIGCGAAGGTAAQFARKTDRKSIITVFEKGRYPQYSKCGLPYAISGKIPRIEDLIEFSQDWFKKANINLLLETTVEKIDTNKNIITAKKGNETIEKSYSSLIIASGAKPCVPPIKGVYENEKLMKGIHVLRTIDDARNISSSIIKNKTSVVIGAGLIGLELAESLFNKDMKVIVVEALPSILPNTLDEDMSNLVFEKISSNIKIFTNHIATRIESQSDRIKSIFIKNRETNEEFEIKTDLLVIATGLKPDTHLADLAGCKLNEKGYIVVDNKCKTTVKDIYAIGDCTEFKDFVTKKPIPVGLGSIAVRQGIAAGINAAGGNHLLLDGVLQTCTSEFFEIEIASVGICDKNLVSGKFNGSTLPNYYPGGKPITIKIYASDKGKILGAQAVGGNAAQRINTIGVAILGGLDVETFKKFETAYAPPIAPTLDAVTLACDIISAKLSRRR